MNGASWPLQCSCSSWAGLCWRATADSWTLQRFCNTPGRCNCCFMATATPLKHSWSLQMLLPGHCNAPAALGPGFADGPLLIHGHCNGVLLYSILLNSINQINTFYEQFVSEGKQLLWEIMFPMVFCDMYLRLIMSSLRDRTNAVSRPTAAAE